MKGEVQSTMQIFDMGGIRAIDMGIAIECYCVRTEYFACSRQIVHAI